jgi:Zn-dependent peptidase ImmA (M78 family)/transcriptional regulator with XRE-family HTH domain
MERIRSINPERIKWCCDDRGVTRAELAADTNIALPTLQGVLDGTGGGLTFGQLRRVADYFGRGVLFFLDREPADANVIHTPQFRSLANQKVELSPKLKTLIERVERQREVFLTLQEDLQDEVPRYERPKIPRRNDLAGAAAAVRKWLGLGAANDFTSYRNAVQAKGILVFRSNGYHGKWQIPKESPILGFALFDPRCPVIVVRKERWETRQSFTLMHELAHIVLHQTSSIDDATDFQSHEGHEQEANMFAGHLLVPEVFLDQINDDERPADVADFDTWLRPQWLKWTVSTEVILRRLLDSGRLPQEDYLNYRAWRDRQPASEEAGGSRAYRHREPMHIFGDGYVRTVLDSLSGRRITLTRASAYLDDLKIVDLHKLERFYADL